MLQKSPEHAGDSDVFAQPWHAGNQGTDSSHPYFDGNPRHARPVKRVDDDLIDQRVELEPYSGGLVCCVVFHFRFDEIQEAFAEVARGNQHASVFLFYGVARELVEQPGEFLADLLVCREIPVVLIHPTRFGVVVSGSDVGVMAQGAIRFLANDHGELAVGFEPHQSIDHVDAGLFKLSCPRNIGLLIKSCLNFNQGEDRFTRLRRPNQRLDDGTVAARAVEGLFDGQHVGVPRSLFKERLDTGGKRLIGVMNKDVTVTNRAKNIRFLCRL